MEKEDEAGGSLRRADDCAGAEITCHFPQAEDGGPPEMQLKLGGKFAFMWDGTYYRQLLRGSCPGPPHCTVGERCIEAATYAASTGCCGFHRLLLLPERGRWYAPERTRQRPNA